MIFMASSIYEASIAHLQPYQLVKDNRTNIEVTNPERVLDGDISVFLEASVYQGIH